MKKITFLFLTFITISFLGQDKITSSTSEYFDGTNWVDSYRTEYSYDGRNNLTTETEYNRSSTTSEWMKSYETTYTYNANNKAVIELYKNYEFNTNTISNQYRTNYSYNSNGNLIEILDEDFENSVWTKSSKFELTYSNNKIVSAIGYIWDGNKWIIDGEDSSSISISYNANGKINISESKSWNGSEWVASLRTVYSYDGLTVLEDGQTWNGSNWISDYKSEYTYDSNGNIVKEKESYLDNGVWIIALDETITFDTTKLMSNFAHPFKDKTGIDDIFNVNGIINKILSKSSDNNKTTYNYGEPTASVNKFDTINFSVYPNPTSTILQIDDANFSLNTVEVYNLLGKRVMLSKDNKLDIRNLDNGVYVLKVQSEDGKIATKRIVKN